MINESESNSKEESLKSYINSECISEISNEGKINDYNKGYTNDYEAKSFDFYFKDDSLNLYYDNFYS